MRTQLINSTDTTIRKTYVFFIKFTREHWKLFNIRSSRHQFYSQRWILRWSFAEQLYQLRFLENTTWFLQKQLFYFFSDKSYIFVAFSSQRHSLNITPQKWYLPKTCSCNKNYKIWTSEVIPDSNKTIDDQYLYLDFLVPKYIPVHCCSVENKFWKFINFSESTFFKVCSLAHILLMMFALISCLFFLYVAYILFHQFIHTFLLKRYVFYGL